MHVARPGASTRDPTGKVTRTGHRSRTPPELLPRTRAGYPPWARPDLGRSGASAPAERPTIRRPTIRQPAARHRLPLTALCGGHSTTRCCAGAGAHPSTREGVSR